MDAKQLLILGASVLASSLIGPAEAQETHQPYVRVAEIEIDPTQIEPSGLRRKSRSRPPFGSNQECWRFTPWPIRRTRRTSGYSRCTPTSTHTSPTSRRLISRNTRRSRKTW